MNHKLGRRSFLSSIAAAASGLFGSRSLFAATAHKSEVLVKGVDGSRVTTITSGLGSTGDIYAELGVTPIINIDGTITVVGGTLMKPDVIELLRMGNEHFVLINELEVAAGKRIAQMCKSPAGYTGFITSGSAASIMVSYAAMLAEDFESRMLALPDTEGFPRTEVIVQKRDRYPFDHQIRQTGAKLIEVDTYEEMVAAINSKTLAIHFCPQSHRGSVTPQQIVEIAKAHGIYTFCDAGGSSDLPPKRHLWEWPEMGFDLCCYGGGKDVSGPASTGILIGKEQLIKWVQLNMSPQENRIGRTCKVGKEQIFALLRALENFVNADEDAVLKMYDARAQVITEAVSKYGVRSVPRSGVFGEALKWSWEWDADKLPLTGRQVREQLASTRPVAIGFILPQNYAASQGMRGRSDPGQPAPVPHDNVPGGIKGNPHSLSLSTWVLKEGEDKIVANRLAEIFRAATKT